MDHRLKNNFGLPRWNYYVMWVMWNLILVHLDPRWVHGLRQMYLRLRNLVSVRLETVLVSVQDR
jgi:hypothetical protein